MEDEQTFRIFRHVRIRTASSRRPEGVFVVRFKLAKMAVEQSILFSLLPMMLILGFRGFREK